MKKTTFLIIVFLTIISVGCGHSSDRSRTATSENSEIDESGLNNITSDEIDEPGLNKTTSGEFDGTGLNNIPSGKYELFSILNTVYEANPNAFDNQVKRKEFYDMLSATLNNRAKKNPNLLTEFPAEFYTILAHEYKDGSFLVRFRYSLEDWDYPEMDNYSGIDYRIYTIMDRETYSKMKSGLYKVTGKYKGFLDKSKLKDNYSPLISSLFVYEWFTAKFHATLGDFYYEDVSVEFIEDL